ncbi:MAG TPA: hypothetical protein VGQ52_03505 [Gemmatimonadaceae bacterium]|jgi:hypothetical protein|nr:hypothetical protein [Gemmatimonadaceae bacterium]
MANKILTAFGNLTNWQDSGASLTMTLASLANNTGRIGAQKDFGAGSIEGKYKVRVRFRANAAPTVGNVVRVYLVTAQDANFRAGGFGTTDASITAEARLANTTFVGAVEIDEASTTKDFVAEFQVWLNSRFVSPAIWNASGVALHATASNNEVAIWPVADEVQ